jgi:hypothetical protein
MDQQTFQKPKIARLPVQCTFGTGAKTERDSTEIFFLLF